MKIKLFIILLSMFLLIGCEDVEKNEKGSVEIKQIEEELALDDDLLHRIYEKGVKIAKNSNLFIEELYLDTRKDETVKVYVVDMKNNTGKELGDYSIGQYISCAIVSEGVYSLIGVDSGGNKVDLTSQIMIESKVNDI